jgi:peptidoglycan/LPS O-acetylase OafA/YrhL
MDKLPSRHAENFIPRLEALRGVAALIVAASHVGQIPIGDDHMLVANPRPDHGVVTGFLLRTYLHLSDGLQAVSLFFVLSGFVLTLALSRDGSEPSSLSGRFIIARLFRIYPAIIASVAIFAAVSIPFGVEPQSMTGVVIANMLLLDVSLNGVMWSLQLEVLAIPLIRAAYLTRRRWSREGVYAIAALAVVLVAISFAREWSKLLAPGGPVLTSMYAFVFGVLIADIGPKIAPVLTPRRTTLAAILAVVIFFAAGPVLGPASNWRLIFNALGATSLIALIAYGPQVAILNLLDGRVMRLLGRSSYSFYLLHPLTLIVLWQIPKQITFLLDIGVPAVIVALALLVVSAAATASIAAIFLAFIERPGIAAGRAVTAYLWPHSKLPRRGE